MVLLLSSKFLEYRQDKGKDFELLGEAKVRRQIHGKSNGGEGVVLAGFVI